MANSRINKRKTSSVSSSGSLPGFRYFLRRALLNLRQNLFISSVTVLTIALALLIIGIFLLVTVNLESLSLRWSERIQVTVYFQQDLTPVQLADLTAKLKSYPETSHVEYIDKAEAMKRFRERLKGQESLLEGVSQDVLPAAFEISLRRSYRTPEAISRFVGQLKPVQGMGEIQYGEEWVKRFTSYLAIVKMIGLLVAVFLFIAVIFIVSNTIRLTIYARKDELEVQALVGATRFFIKAPFLLEGCLQGAAGALLAILLLGCGYLVRFSGSGSLLPQSMLNSMLFLTNEQLCGLFFGGLLLGFVGSVTSLRRFMPL